MLRVNIVEDDEKTSLTIESYVKKFFGGQELEPSVLRFGSAEDFLKNYNTCTDIVFMDIELPGKNGMEAVKELRKKDADVIVIFVTNLAQFAVSGYEVSAFDFIVKPIAYGSFAMKLRRVLQVLASRTKREICVSTRQGKTLIKATDIYYVEIMRHVVTYHTVGGTYVGSGTLVSVSGELEGLPFVLCNRCYLVNLRYVTKIVGNDVFIGKDGASLQISAPRRKEFLSKFNSYLAAGGDIK